jgi:hypothetical protein
LGRVSRRWHGLDFPLHPSGRSVNEETGLSKSLTRKKMCRKSCGRGVAEHFNTFVQILYRDPDFDIFHSFDGPVESISCVFSKSCQVRGSNPCRGATTFLPQHQDRVLLTASPTASVACIRNIPRVLARRAFSPFGREVLLVASSTPRVEAGPHVFPCEFSGFSG